MLQILGFFSIFVFVFPLTRKAENETNFPLTRKAENETNFPLTQKAENEILRRLYMKNLCRILISAILMLVGTAVYAKPKPYPWDSLRHEVKLGWGDMLFESAMQYEFTHIGKPNTRIDYLTGHFFAEYEYHWLSWLASGMQIDFFQMGWHDRRELKSDSNAKEHNYYNLSFLPTVRFTWFHSEYVNLYSAAMLGLCINGGTEKDAMTGRKTVCYPAFGLTMLGCQVGKNGWYGSVEWGGLSALLDTNYIAMASARILSVSVSYKF